MYKIEITLKAYSSLMAAEVAGIKHLITSNGLTEVFNSINKRGCNIFLYRRFLVNDTKVLYAFLIISQDKDIRYIFVRPDNRGQYVGSTLINSAKGLLQAGQTLTVKHDLLKDADDNYNNELMKFFSSNNFIAKWDVSLFKRY